MVVCRALGSKLGGVTDRSQFAKSANVSAFALIVSMVGRRALGSKLGGVTERDRAVPVCKKFECISVFAHRKGKSENV